FGLHEVVRFVLDGTGIDRRLDREVLEAFGQSRRPEYRDVGLGRRSKVLEGLEHAKGGLGDKRAPILAHPAHDLRYPYRVARKELVVLGGAQKAHDPPLDHEIVDDLLRLRLGAGAGRKLALELDVTERG